MKTYNLALLIFRSFAIALGIYLLYALVFYFMNPVQDAMPGNAAAAAYLESVRQKGLFRALFVYGGGSILFYFAAPFFALLASAGIKE